MKVNIRYFASLREKAGKSEEEISVEKDQSLREIYLSLSSQYKFPLSPDEIKYAINNEYVDDGVRIQENDRVVFIPPVAGG